jgi:hypothetical protein
MSVDKQYENRNPNDNYVSHGNRRRLASGAA